MELEFTCLSFNDLNKFELYEILKLRQEVFIVEQDCPYLDADGKDLIAHHVIVRLNNKIVAYTRLLDKGVSYSEFSSVGRLINSKEVRGQGVGKKLMMYSIDKIKELYPETNIKISAQSYLIKFYQTFGFQKIGPSYLEDNIPHNAMVLNVHK